MLHRKTLRSLIAIDFYFKNFKCITTHDHLYDLPACLSPQQAVCSFKNLIHQNFPVKRDRRAYYFACWISRPRLGIICGGIPWQRKERMREVPFFPILASYNSTVTNAKVKDTLVYTRALRMPKRNRDEPRSGSESGFDIDIDIRWILLY